MTELQVLTVEKNELYEDFHVFNEKGDEIAYIYPHTSQILRVDIYVEGKYFYLPIGFNEKDIIAYFNDRTKETLRTLALIQWDVRDIDKAISLLNKGELFDNCAVRELQKSRGKYIKSAKNLFALIEPFITKYEEELLWISDKK